MRMPGMKGALLVTALGAAVTLAACEVGPNYRRPATPMPAAYKEAEGWAPANPSDAADRADWWTIFGDPVLNDLEQRVEVSNQNLAAAEAAYRVAHATVAEQRAALFPTVSLNGSASVSGGGGSGSGGTGTGTVTPPRAHGSLIARWAILGGKERKLVFGRKSVIIEPSGAQGSEAMVAANSRALEKLSREIAEAIRTLAKSG